MTILVQEHNADRIEEILDAVSGLDYEADGDAQGDAYQFCSETINIAAGHSDESAAREIAEAIWEANGAFCKVDVGMRDLDADFPSYSWDEASFDKWQQGKDGE
jgi:hypothetical protein